MLKKYLPILLLNFVNIIGFTLLIPILPDIVRSYTEPQYVGLLYGALLSSYALFQFLGSPVLGSLSDKYGRRPVLFLSQLGTLLSWVIFGGALLLPNIPVWGIPLPLIVIAFSRVVDGITGGNISVAQAWISDVTTKEEKTKTFAMMGGVFGFGFLIGPAIGGLTSTTSFGYLGTIGIAFVISLITLGLIHWQLPESLPKEKRDPDFEFTILEEINVWKQLKKFRENRLLFTLLNLRILYSLVFASYTTLIMLFLQSDFGLSRAALGIVLSTIGIYSIVNQVLLAPRVAERFGNLKAMLLSIMLLGAGLATLPFIPKGFSFNGLDLSLILFMVNAFFINVGLSVGQPTFQALVTNSVSDQKQGSIMGLDESLMALGRGISPVLSGGLYSFLGNSLFLVFSVFLVMPYALAWRQGWLKEE